MAGIPEKRARQAAAMVMTSGHALLHQMCVSLLLGADPADPYSWNDPALFDAFMAMQNALDVGDENGIGSAPFKFETCQACQHFAAIKSSRADQKPAENEDYDAKGYCTAHPPVRVGSLSARHDHTSQWTPVDRRQVCGEFRPQASRKLKI